MRQSRSRGSLPKFSEEDFVLVARENFAAGEKVALLWRGLRRVVKAQSEYVFRVEELRNGVIEEAHCSRLKFYHDSSLDQKAIMPNVIASETGMPVQRLLRLVDADEGLKVLVCWRGLPGSEDTLEPPEKVYEDVLQLFEKPLCRKNTPMDLVRKARLQLL